jgi:hypothetical protein
MMEILKSHSDCREILFLYKFLTGRSRESSPGSEGGLEGCSKREALSIIRYIVNRRGIWGCSKRWALSIIRYIVNRRGILGCIKRWAHSIIRYIVNRRGIY